MTKRFAINAFSLAIGLLLGAFSVSAFAGLIWSNKDGMITRNADGSVSTIRLATPDDYYEVAQRQLQSNPDYLKIVESGNWEVLDKDGRSVAKVPGKQSITIPKDPLVKAAGSAAWLLKGSVQGAIVSALLSKGIELLDEKWQTKQDSPIYPDAWFQGGTFADWFKDAQSAMDNKCAYLVSLSGGYAPSIRNVQTSSSTTYFTCEGQYTKDNGSVGYMIWTYLTVVPVTRCEDGRVMKPTEICGTVVKPVPVTQQQLEDALDKRTRDNDNALADYYRAISQQERERIAKDSGTIDATGGSVQSAPVVTKTTAPNGAVTTNTTTTTYNVTNQGNTYNTSVVTVTSNSVSTTTITNPDGTTQTSTTQTQKDPSTPEEQNNNFVDSDLPPVPDFYQAKYENGIKGVWADKASQIKGSSIFSLLRSLTSGAPDSGSCPSWQFNLQGLGLGAFPLEPPCFIWPFIRWLLIISALFTARRMVFGG